MADMIHSLMYHSLIILLHRPFLSDGHLKSIAVHTRDDFTICEAAACSIDVLLACYAKKWCMKTVPYFISYATYVSATIHVRAAARHSRGGAHQRLRRCLDILSEHQKVCHAPRRALANLLLVVQRLGVDVGSVPVLPSRTETCNAASMQTQLMESGFSNEEAPAGDYPLTPVGNNGAGIIITTSGFDEFNDTSLNAGEDLSWMSWFDLDPIVGFSNFDQ